MKRLNFALAAAALLAVGCSSNDEEITTASHQTENNAINFDTYQGGYSRGVLDATNFDQFFVVAWDANANEGKGAVYENMSGVRVSKNDKNEWVYYPLAYWPKEDGFNLSFFGIMTDNIADKDELGNTKPLPIEVDAETGATAQYTYKDEDSKLESGIVIPSDDDLILAASGSRTTRAAVPMQFKHALTRISFGFTTSDKFKYKILSITLTNLLQQDVVRVSYRDTPDPKYDGVGTLIDWYNIRSTSTGKGTDNVVPRVSYKLQKEAMTGETQTATDPLNVDINLMLIPQYNVGCEVAYKIYQGNVLVGDGTVTGTLSANKDAADAWKPGLHYRYMVDLNTTAEGLVQPITFTPTLVPWPSDPTSVNGIVGASSGSGSSDTPSGE